MSGLDYVRDPVHSTHSWHNNKWHRLHSPQPSPFLVTADNPQSSLFVLRGSSQKDMFRRSCLNHSAGQGRGLPHTSLVAACRIAWAPPWVPYGQGSGPTGRAGLARVPCCGQANQQRSCA